MSVPYEEFEAFTRSAPYKELIGDIHETISFLAAEIINRDHPAPDRDMYVRGVIAGLRTMLEWKPDLSKEEEDGDEA